VKRRAIKLFALAMLGASWAVSAVPATAGAAGCPNEIFRNGLSGQLPECRAYEMVSPPEKWNSDVEPRGNFVFRGVSGVEGGYAFASVNGLPGSENGGLGNGNVAERGPDGWTGSPLMPPETNHGTLLTSPPLLISRDLNQAIVPSRVPLTAGAQPGDNLYLRTVSPPSLRLITPIAPGTTNSLESRFFLGASNDFSRVFFQSSAKLTPDSVDREGLNRYNLYEWNGSSLTNIGILPGETQPISNGIVGSLTPWRHFVSPDGQRVVFTSEGVYLRDHGTPIEVSKPAPGAGSMSSNEPIFVGASTDISSVYFLSASNLTADAFTGELPSGQQNLAANLYRYDVETGELTDLTVDRADERGAAVMNAIVAPDGEAAFFVAGGVLAPGGTLGASNLYRWSSGNGIEFVAKVGSADALTILYTDPEATSDDTGDAVAFVSTAAPTGEAPVGVKEIYHWSTSEGLTCVSCAPGGLPIGAEIPPPSFNGGAGPHPMSADGSKVFFSTTAQLVPQDTNGKMDAYEWAHGEVHLISSGTGEYGAEFLDANPSARDVFFVTRDRLVGADRDENTDVYDAREDGGFPEPPLSIPCEAEACRPPLEAAPPAPQVGSRSFNGPANSKPTHQKKKHKKHKHHKRRAKHHKKKAKACKAKTKRCPRASHHRGTTGKRG